MYGGISTRRLPRAAPTSVGWETPFRWLHWPYGTVTTTLVIGAESDASLNSTVLTSDVRTLVGAISAYPYCGQRGTAGTASTRGAVAVTYFMM